MVSVIVFSKDRPMQIHAYLESLIMYSKINQRRISVIYKESDNIKYNKVISAFPNVKWINERSFKEDLANEIREAGDCIMFGCDDVVFRRPIDLEQAEKCLTEDTQVYGYSLRLGSNLIPYPHNIEQMNGYLRWKWEEASALHFNYPFELDCTIYRKNDIKSLVDQYRELCTNPNNLEGIAYKNLQTNVNRPYLAMAGGENQAIVITVNRVQNTSLNAVDDSMNYTVEYLQKKYEQDNQRLDIKKISSRPTSVVHVDSSFVYFTNSGSFSNIWRRNKIYAKNFIHNLKYLFTHSIANEQVKMRNEAISYIHEENEKGKV